MKRAGAEGKPITFKGLPGKTPIIDGSKAGNEFGVFRIFDTKYVVVDGIRCINGYARGESGIHCQNSANLLVTRCQTFDTFSSGIKLIQCTDTVVDGNDVDHGCQGGAEECITVKIDSDRIQISNNHVHDGKDEGIDIKEGARNVRVFNNHVDHIARQGLYADAWNRETYNIEFFNNVVHDCGFGMAACAETGGLLHDIRYYNNVVYNVEGPGMVVASWGREGNHPIDGVYFINNTIVKAGTRWGGGLRLENPQAKNVVARNNIFVGCGSPTVQLWSEPVSGGIDHNLFDAEGEWQGINKIIGQPMFVDPEHGDFHLKAGSPAIDAGSAEAAPATDAEGQKRPSGKAVDMGAYELKEGK